MYLDLEEFRGFRCWLSSGVTQPRITWAWNRATALVGPDLVIDGGANYGEVALSGKYAPNARVLLVEANPALSPFLRQSVASRAIRKKSLWETHEVALSERSGEGVLRLSGISSGQSYLTKESEVKCRDEQTVATQTLSLDDLTKGFSANRILIKLDIEGGEVAALRGATRLLRDADKLFLIVEMDDRLLRRSGASSRDLWNLARQLGKVALFDHDRQLRDFSNFSYDQILELNEHYGLRLNRGVDLFVWRGFELPLWQFSDPLGGLRRLLTRAKL